MSGNSSFRPDLELAFDVGHSSIGWAVLQTGAAQKVEAVDVLGCGAVIFRADDCLASARRGYRRQRRHIRSTRQRIARLKVLIQHLGALTAKELDAPGCAWPWYLAARVLAKGKRLTWLELWNVLRWYAHNRGYDGNRRWSAAGVADDDDDTEKEENAKNLMHRHGTQSMAATFCKELEVDPLGVKRASLKRFKGLNAAFPRGVVETEVRAVLQAHFGKLKGVDAAFEKALMDDWRALPCPDLKQPARYQGGLLFGQLVPRFDNRIIATCPITFHEVYTRELARTKDPEAAKKTAQKLAKVPSRNHREFLEFRWGMLLANVRVGRLGEKQLTPLTVPERKEIDTAMREEGGMGPEELKKVIRKAAGAVSDNLDTMFMHPDAKDALLLDPVQKLIKGDIQAFWPLLPERLQKRLRGQWRKGKVVTLEKIREQLSVLANATVLEKFDAEVQRALDARNTRARQKGKPSTRQDLLDTHYPGKPLRLDGRAAFARPLLAKAYQEVMAGKHPKEEGGCLFLGEDIRRAQQQREIAEQTNNHLVRHRLLILGRLVQDLIKEPAYANGDKKRIGQLTIEVNRDLREMSGLTAKAKEKELGRRIANHHAVARKLEEALEGEKVNGKRIQITAGLIRKARIADDLGWRCPYTGKEYEPKDLAKRAMDKDHVVPRADRASDSLDSLVITFPAVNKWKGKRTAWQFVEQEQGKPVPDLPNVTILPLAKYKKLVNELETFRGHNDDRRRKERRQKLLLLPRYTEKEFVQGDLTQTSQLVRLGEHVLESAFRSCARPPAVVALPGQITGKVRTTWRLAACLSLANPWVLDEDGEARKKEEIRDITHLHHALDACVLGLASHFIPNNGRVWKLIAKRHLNDQERRELAGLDIFGFDSEGRFVLHDLNNCLKEQVRQRLAEKRVVQHIPARMDGLRVEQNMWRVVKVEDGVAMLRQRDARQPDGKRPVKEAEEKVGKLLGLNPGKLNKNKGVLVVPDNYGVAILDHAAAEGPRFAVIPYHKVWDRVQELRSRNSGKAPRVLRIGALVRVVNKTGRGDYRGTWVIRGCTDNKRQGVLVDLSAPDVIKYRIPGRSDCFQNVRLEALVNSGLEVLRPPYTGVSSCPTTSSA